MAVGEHSIQTAWSGTFFGGGGGGGGGSAMYRYSNTRTVGSIKDN